MRSLVAIPAQLVTLVAEDTLGGEFEEAIVIFPHEGRGLLFDGLIGHEHLPKLLHLLIGIETILIVIFSEVMSWVFVRRAIIFILILWHEHLLNKLGVLLLHVHVVVLVGQDVIVALRIDNKLDQSQGKDKFVHCSSLVYVDDV